jgi:hypothetical protein
MSNNRKKQLTMISLSNWPGIDADYFIPPLLLLLLCITLILFTDPRIHGCVVRGRINPCISPEFFKFQFSSANVLREAVLLCYDYPLTKLPAAYPLD